MEYNFEKPPKQNTQLDYYFQMVQPSNFPHCSSVPLITDVFKRFGHNQSSSSVPHQLLLGRSFTRATERFLRRVFLRMSSERRRTSEALRTNCARKGLLPGVRSYVRPQIRLTRKGFSANRARERFHAGVYRHVRLHVVFVVKPSRAHRAGKRFLPRMPSHVSFDIPFEGESFLAKGASERFHPHVRYRVTFQRSFVGKYFLTLRAVEFVVDSVMRQAAFRLVLSLQRFGVAVISVRGV